MRLDLIAVSSELVNIEILSVQGMISRWYYWDIVLMHDTMVNNFLFDYVVKWVEDSFFEFSLDKFEVLVSTETDMIDSMTKVDCIDSSCSHDSWDNLGESVRWKMEVAWNFVDLDEAFEMTSFLVVYRLHQSVIINLLTLIMGVTMTSFIVLLLTINRFLSSEFISSGVHSLYKQITTNVHEVSSHYVLCVQWGDIARKSQ